MFLKASYLIREQDIAPTSGQHQGLMPGLELSSWNWCWGPQGCQVGNCVWGFPLMLMTITEDCLPDTSALWNCVSECIRAEASPGSSYLPGNSRTTHVCRSLGFVIKSGNNNKENRTNSSKEEKKMWQLNLGVCAFILIIFVFGRGVALGKDLNVGLSNTFSCGMSPENLWLRSKFKPIVISLHDATYGVADLCRMVLCRCRMVMMLHCEAKDSI